MTIQEAIGWFESKLIVNERFRLLGNQNEAAKLALVALREQEERMPNPPLTLEELQRMNGEPVWVYVKKYKLIKCRVISNIDESLVRFTDGAHDWIKDYGKTWIAYRQKPEDGIT